MGPFFTEKKRKSLNLTSYYEWRLDHSNSAAMIHWPVLKQTGLEVLPKPERTTMSLGQMACFEPIETFQAIRQDYDS